MADKFFDDLDDLFEEIENDIEDVMDQEVADKVRDVEQQMVYDVVYDAYTAQDPYVERRNGNGGLADKDNMVAYIDRNGDEVELFVDNVARGNPDADYTNPNVDLDAIIEFGRLPDRLGLYTKNKTGTEDQYLRARPFISETINELERTLSYIDALRDGLKRRGLDVE